jgi:hypothetical protein
MKKMLLVMALVGLLMVPSGVRANSITPTLISVTPVGLQFDWTYELFLGLGAAWSSTTICGAPCPPPTTGSGMFQFYDFHGYDADGPDDALGAEFLGAALDNYPISETLSLGPDQTPATADDGVWVLFPNKFGDSTDPDGPDNVFGTSDDHGPSLNTGNGACEADLGPINNFGKCPPDSPSIWNLLVAYASGPTVDATSSVVSLGFVTIRSDLGGPAALAEAYFSQDAKNAGICGPVTGRPHKPATNACNPVQSNFGRYEGPSAIPEPTSLLLLGTGLLGLGSRLRKNVKKDAPTV